MKKIISILLLLIIFLMFNQCKKMIGGDFEQPYVVSYNPSDKSVVQRDSVIVINFNKAMDTQMTENSFSVLTEGGGMLAVRVRWSNGNSTMTCTPLSLLEPNQMYTVRVATSAEDSKGNDLKNELRFIFNVIGLQSDRPRFVSSTPSHMEVGVLRDATITLIFSKPIDRNTIGTGIIILPTVDYTPAWHDGGTRIVLTPINPLDGPKSYTVTLNQTLKDLDGNKLFEEKSFIFTVGSDFSKPLVTRVTIGGVPIYDPALPVNWEPSTYYYDDQINTMPVISITFNKDMDQVKFASLFPSSFTVPCNITWATLRQVNITPLVPLTHGSLNNIILTTDYKEALTGNVLNRNYNFRFRMGLDLTPLRMVDLKIIAPGYVDQPLLGDADKEIIVPGNQANKCSIRIVFNDTVDTGTFESNFSVSMVTSKSFSWSTTVKPNDTVVVSFPEILKWHARYTLSFNENIKSKVQNSMERVDYYINIGDDYVKPIINAVAATGGTELPAVVNIPQSILITDFVTKVEKKDYFYIDFTESMNIDSLTSEIFLRNASNNQTTNFYVVVDLVVPNRYLFYPKTTVDSDTKYRVVVTNKATDLQGNIISNVGFNNEIYFDFYVDAENSSYVKIIDGAPTGSPDISKIWKKPWGDPVYGNWEKMDNLTGTLNFQSGPPIVINDWLIIVFNKKLDAHSVYGKISITPLLGSGGFATITIPMDQIFVNTNFDETTGTCVLIKKMGLSTAIPDNMYILKVMGGSEGVKDVYGNTLKETFEYRIKIQ